MKTTAAQLDRRGFIRLIAGAAPAALGLASGIGLPGLGTLLRSAVFDPVAAAATGPDPLAGLQVIDTHSHLQPRGPHHPQNDFGGAVETALEQIGPHGISRTIIMPPPLSPDTPAPYDFEQFASEMRRHPDRFSYLGGGGTLNPMLQTAVGAGTLDAEVERRFEARAREILAGGALGFGEMACEHFSFNERHPYESAPPDHPLMLRLADIAAERGVPIDIHMEAVRAEMPMPARIRKRSPNNPSALKANIDRLGALLASNRKTSIIWAHVGWDNTGDRTADLCDELMSANPNLYMSLKTGRTNMPINQLIGPDGTAHPVWVRLVSKFPDRFLIGTDRFYDAPGVYLRDAPEVVDEVLNFVRQLPADVARKVAAENPTRLYGLASNTLSQAVSARSAEADAR